MEKDDIIRVNLLIMKTLWDAYFHHLISPDDKETDFYEFLGQGSTKTSKMINGTDSLFKDGVKKGVAEKTGMSMDVLGGKHLLHVWNKIPAEFLKKGIDTEEGMWDEYFKNGKREYVTLINTTLYAELKTQVHGRMLDVELVKMLEYMKGKKNIVKKVQEEIQKVSLSILNKCTPTELSNYEKALLEEYQLVHAIRILQTSKKMRNGDIIEQMEEKLESEKN